MNGSDELGDGRLDIKPKRAQIRSTTGAQKVVSSVGTEKSRLKDGLMIENAKKMKQSD